MNRDTRSNPLPPLWPRRRFIGTLAAATALPAAAQFRVEITGIGGTQIPVVVPTFRDEDKSPVPVSAVVRADLQRSGLFRIVDVPGSFDESSRINVADWRARGADALAVGSVSRLADGRFDVRFKLWDLVKGEELLGQGHAALPADMRLAAHRVADSIYQNLTGERGVFSTRIAYVTRTAGRYCAAHHRCRRRGRADRIGQPRPDHLAGLGAGRQGAGLRLLRKPEGRGLGAGREQRQAPHAGQLPRLQQRAGLVAGRTRPGADLVA